MLLTIGFALIALWLFGSLLFPAIGWLIHVLLALAIIMILVRIIRGR